MTTEWLGHLKISKNPTGNQTRDLQFCGAVPQPTAVQLDRTVYKCNEIKAFALCWEMTG
jgi:hypothetical protein